MCKNIGISDVNVKRVSLDELQETYIDKSNVQTTVHAKDGKACFNELYKKYGNTNIWGLSLTSPKEIR